MFCAGVYFKKMQVYSGLCIIYNNLYHQCSGTYSNFKVLFFMHINCDHWVFIFIILILIGIIGHLPCVNQFTVYFDSLICLLQLASENKMFFFPTKKNIKPGWRLFNMVIHVLKVTWCPSTCTYILVKIKYSFEL